jgi:GNAT superfamily N-acetyltransferase
VEVRRAAEEDVERVAGLLEEAAAWLRSRGIDQWPARFPREGVARRVRERECYLAWDGADAVGTFSLQPSDPVLWGERPADAVYLHGLAVRRTHRGLGRELLAWAERAAAAAGKRYLRLDCNAGNPRLCAYYRDAGFLHVGDRLAEDWSASLFEKRVTGCRRRSLAR